MNERKTGAAKANEQRYYDALKRITEYMSPERLRRNAGKMYGLDVDEALEMAYGNVLTEAASAIRGRRRPKSAALTSPLK